MGRNPALPPLYFHQPSNLLWDRAGYAGFCKALEDVYLKAYSSMKEARRGLCDYFKFFTMKKGGIKTLTERHQVWFTSSHWHRNRLGMNNIQEQLYTYKALLTFQRSKTTSLLWIYYFYRFILSCFFGFV